MNISGFLIRIVFLALPGIVGSMTFRKLRGRFSRQRWEDFCEIVLFSLVSYGLYAAVLWFTRVLHWTQWELTLLRAVFDEKVPIAWHEIITATLISVPISFLACFVYTHNLVNRLGRWVRVTRKYGDEDVWHILHNSPDVDWVFVRDHKVNLVYYGWIWAFSDSGKTRELLLKDVDVYANVSGEFMYSAEALYICRSRYDLTIELGSRPVQAEREIPGSGQEKSDG